MEKRKRFNVEVKSSGNGEKGLRQIRKKMEREGILRKTKEIYFESPAEKKRKRLIRAIKNNILKNGEYMDLKKLRK